MSGSIASSLRQVLLHDIIAWSSACADIRAVALVGSNARADHPADEWSDIDLVLIAANPDLYLQSSTWLNAIGEPWIITVERDPDGCIVERRVLFRSGIDVDFIVLAPDRIGALQEEPLASILSRGVQVLLDQDQIFPPFQLKLHPEKPACPPSSAEFSELVNDFLFHCIWTAKKIKRGELWTAKSCCDIYMKKLLVTMIEWHTQALNGWTEETWYNGRFMEHWAGANVVAALCGVFAHYDEEEIKKALLNTIQLFDELARETAQQLSYSYPQGEAQSIIKYLYDRYGFLPT